MATVQFRQGTQAGYNSLTAPRDANTIFFITDTNALYHGDRLISDAVRLVTARPDNPAHGVLYFNTDTRKGEVYNGTEWTDIVDFAPPMQDRFVTTEEVSGGIGETLTDLDLTLVSPIMPNTELSVRDIVIFPSGAQGEVSEIDEVEETFAVVIFFIGGTTPTAPEIKFESAIPAPVAPTPPDPSDPDYDSLYEQYLLDLDEYNRASRPLTSENVAAALDELTERNQATQNSLAEEIAAREQVQADLVETNRIVQGGVTKTTTETLPKDYVNAEVPLATIGGIDPDFSFITAQTWVGDQYGTQGVYISHVGDPETATHINVQIKTWAGEIEWGTF